MASPPSSYSLPHLSSSSSLPPLTSSPVAPFDLSTSQHQPSSINDQTHSSSVNSVTSSLLTDRRSSSPSAMDSIGDHHHSSSLSPNYSHYYYTGGGGVGSVTSMTPQLVSIREDESHGTPTASPILRPASGRFVGGMKKLLRIPSGPQAAGVSTSTVQAELSSVTTLSPEATPSIDPPPGDLETNERSRIFHKVMKQIKRHPRVLHPAFRRPHSTRRKASSRSRNRHHHHHYSGDDGYTSDPGLLRDAIHASHDEDPEEEEDTESGDRESEVRAERIARIQVKLEKYKKLLQEEETALQEAQNVYVVGMEESISDKEQHRIKKHFISKQAKSKDEIDQLKRKVEHYEEQLQEIKQRRGGDLVLTSHHMRYNKVRNHFSRIRHLGSGGVKHGIKILRRKKTPNSSSQGEVVIDVEDDDEEEVTYHPVDDIEAESHISFTDDHHIDMKEDDPPCEYCLNEYNNLLDMINEQKKTVSMIQQDHSLLFEKLQQEKDKTDRLENELNTLTDLHQNGIIELRGQLAQMERLSFGKSQDLEDNIENCQARLHSLEVKITNTDTLISKPVRNGLVRSIFVPFLSYMLFVISICFKLSEHMGKKTFLAIFIIVIGIIIYYLFLF